MRLGGAAVNGADGMEPQILFSLADGASRRRSSQRRANRLGAL